MCLYVFQKRLRRTSATIFKDIISGAAKVMQKKSTVILIATQVKTYFHTSILAIWQIKDHK